MAKYTPAQAILRNSIRPNGTPWEHLWAQYLARYSLFSDGIGIVMDDSDATLELNLDEIAMEVESDNIYTIAVDMGEVEMEVEDDG